MLYFTFISVRENERTFATSLSPSYFDYKSYCQAVGLKIKFLQLDQNYDFDDQELLDLSDNKNCKLIILCNPNNPTGNLIDNRKIINILENSNKLVIIDETYFEFSGNTFSDRIDKYPNLIIIRSFSKAFSAAGLRFGYIISSEKNIKELEKVMTLFHSSLMIQAFTLSILENKEIFQKHTKKVIELKEKTFNELNSIPGIIVLNTATNFLLFTIGQRTPELFNFLSENEIALRPLRAFPILKDFLRLTISNENEIALFLKYLKNFIAS